MTSKLYLPTTGNVFNKFTNMVGILGYYWNNSYIIKISKYDIKNSYDTKQSTFFIVYDFSKDNKEKSYNKIISIFVKQ
jgi:hypothetical protein